MRRYFFINKRLGNKSRVPLDSPHRKDLRKNLKSEFHGLAELSTGNTYDKQMTSIKQALSPSQWNFMHKIHSWVPIFGVQKTKSSFQLVWTTFVHYLLWSKIKSIGTVCGLPTHNIFRTLIKLPNFSFDVQSQLLDLISFRDAAIQGWQSKVAQDLGAVSKHGARRAPWWFQP